MLFSSGFQNGHKHLLVVSGHIRGFKIRGDFEAYLPGGSDAEKVLKEMKRNWSTDLATIFIETNNKFDPTDETNITDVKVLKEISALEESLNYDKLDKGRNELKKSDN